MLTPHKASLGKRRRLHHWKRSKPAQTKCHWKRCRECFGSVNFGQGLCLLNPQHPGCGSSTLRSHSVPHSAAPAGTRTGLRAATLLRGKTASVPPPCQDRAATPAPMNHLTVGVTGIFRSQQNPHHQQDSFACNSWKRNAGVLPKNIDIPALKQTSKQLPVGISPPHTLILPFCPEAPPERAQTLPGRVCLAESPGAVAGLVSWLLPLPSSRGSAPLTLCPLTARHKLLPPGKLAALHSASHLHSERKWGKLEPQGEASIPCPSQEGEQGREISVGHTP